MFARNPNATHTAFQGGYDDALQFIRFSSSLSTLSRHIPRRVRKQGDARASDTWYWTASVIVIGTTWIAVVSTAQAST